jgi:hypothetical protein
MKALSIKQPWLHAILTEGKDIENRIWQTEHRGWIALHASAKPVKDVKFPGRIKVPDLKTLDYSAICGVARISEIVTKSRSRWFDRPEDGSDNYGWVLTDVVPLPSPIPWPGALRLWSLPPAVLRKLKQQLPKIDFSK